VFAAIERDTPFYDESGGGVTFSGGEPLSQPRFLLDVLERCAARDIHTAVDTCGYAPTRVLRRVAEKTDLFLFDLKCMDPARHVELTGVDNARILENLRTLSALGKAVTIRVPVIPGFTDTNDNLEAIGRFVSTLSPAPPVELLPHHAVAMDKYRRFGMDGGLSGYTAAPDEHEMRAHAARLDQFGLEVTF
jgi:pyruvate formate lyase activating enzyme